MRILLVTLSLPPAGGAEKITWDLALTLANKHDVFLLIPGDNEKIYNRNGVVIIECPIQHCNYYYIFITPLYMKRLIEFINPDVIHSHIPTIFSFIFNRMTIKKIVTLHNSEFEYYHNTILKKIKFKLFVKATLSKCEKLTTVSTRMQKYFSEKLKREVINIPNGIDTSVFELMKSKLRKKKIDHIRR